MKNKFLILIAASLLFISCVNDIQSPDSENNITQDNPGSLQTPGTTDEPVKYVSIQGSFIMEGAIPSEIQNLNQNNNFQSDGTRTAMPSLPDGCKYYVIATASGQITKRYEVTVGQSNQNGDFTVNGNTYLLKNLASSKLGIIWTVEFGIKNGDTVIMSDSNPFKLTEEVPVYVHDFLLKPEIGGTGTVSLEMKVPSTIKQVTSNNSKFSCSAPDTNGKVIVSGASVNTGCYKVTFEFWDKAAGAQDENKKLRLYSDTQVINVLKGCETKTWISNGGTDVVKNGVYEVTASHLDTFKRTTFYIGPTAFCTTASDLNNGSPADPVLSLNRVASIIANQNISNRTYTIYINIDIEGPQSLTDALDGKAQKIIISGNEVQSNGYPKFNLKGLQTGSSLTVGTSVEVELKDLIITNGKAENGGGINITKGTVSADNVRINFNEATASGGGVYIAAGASFTMKGTSVMSSNSVSTGGTGSGVYVAASNSTTASFTISDTANVSNDVFLAQNGNYIATINVTGLSTDAASTVATITPENAKRNLAVLSGTNISNLYSKFQTSYDADSFAINNEGKLVLAKILTTIYVGNTTVGTTNYTAANPSGNTKDDSTWKHFNSNVSYNYSQRHPFTTIEKALQFITWQNSNEDYTITISGTIAGANTIKNNSETDNPITLTYNSNIKKLTLTGTNTGTLDGGFSATAGNGTTLTIDTAVPITITSLTIKNGYQSQGNGGSLYIANSSANVTLSTSATIRDGKANKGGCIYNKGTLTIQTGATVRDGEALVYNNIACGGGIYNEKTLNMTGGQIQYCYAGPRNDDTVTIGDGAFVYLSGNNAVYNMSGGHIGDGGSAKGNGGGVYVGVGAKIFMSGTACIGKSNSNTTASSGSRYCEAKNGGGLYVLGSAYIGYTNVSTPDGDFSGGVRYNYASQDGGGIFIATTDSNAGEVYMARGFVMHNRSGRNGGAVCSSVTGTKKGSFVIKNGEISTNLAASNGLGGGIYNVGILKIEGETGENNGVTFSGNSFYSPNNSACGGAIYSAIDATFEIKGKVNIASTAAQSNDIYLVGQYSNNTYTSAKIKITDSLTGGQMRITPGIYDTSASRLATSDYMDTDYIKFDVTPQGTTNYYLGGTGKLYRSKTAKAMSDAPSSGIVAVCTQKDLEQIKNWVNSDGNNLSGVTISLDEDITIDDTYSGIGTTYPSYRPFSGTFDGNYHTINYNSAKTGIFANTDSADIYAIKTTGTIASTGLVGAVINTMVKGEISYCVNYASVSGSVKYGGSVGGIVGKVGEAFDGDQVDFDNSTGRTGKINKCKNWGTITGSADSFGNGSVGGIVGEAFVVKIYDCVNYGSVRITSTGDYTGNAGGIVGSTSLYDTTDSYCCDIVNCGNSGSVSGNGEAAGICGSSNNGNSNWKNSIKNCWTLYSVISGASGKTGGIAPGSQKEMVHCYVKGDASANFYPGTTELTGCTITNGAYSTFYSSLNTWNSNYQALSLNDWYVDGEYLALYTNVDWWNNLMAP